MVDPRFLDLHDSILDRIEQEAAEIGRQLGELEAEMERIFPEWRLADGTALRLRFMELLAKQKALGEKLLRVSASIDATSAKH